MALLALDKQIFLFQCMSPAAPLPLCDIIMRSRCWGLGLGLGAEVGAVAWVETWGSCGVRGKINHEMIIIVSHYFITDLICTARNVISPDPVRRQYYT